MNIHQKYQVLVDSLKTMGQVAIGFSGGVDSTFLLKAAVETLGPDNVLACIGTTPLLPDKQLDQARQLAETIGVRLIEIPMAEMEDEEFRANQADRCYRCKGLHFRTIRKTAQSQGFEHVLCGTNLDDQSDYRPGNRALQEMEISTPMVDAKLTKKEIRQLSRELDLPTADKPASPCLASRIAYGQKITRKKLRQIDAAEEFLHNLGFAEVRLRHHGNLARIEVPINNIKQITREPIRTEILEKLKSLGFKYVTLDLQGFRSGAMNEMLTDKVKRRHQ